MTLTEEEFYTCMENADLYFDTMIDDIYGVNEVTAAQKNYLHDRLTKGARETGEILKDSGKNAAMAVGMLHPVSRNGIISYQAYKKGKNSKNPLVKASAYGVAGYSAYKAAKAAKKEYDNFKKAGNTRGGNSGRS